MSHNNGRGQRRHQLLRHALNRSLVAAQRRRGEGSMHHAAVVPPLTPGELQEHLPSEELRPMMSHERDREALGGGHEDRSDVSAQQERTRRGGKEPEGADAILVGVSAVDLVLASAKVAGAQEGWQMPEQPVGVGDDGEGRYDGP